MKVIYLGAYEAYHPNFDVVYQDINGKRDLGGDMLEVDLKPYDVIIATPPCNYWSIANYRRDTSEYAQKTRHLLPAILDKLIALSKPFVVENVRNKPLFTKYGLYKKKCYIYTIGRHTYWSNILLSDGEINKLKTLQTYDFSNTKGYTVRLKKNSQGGDNVHLVIDYFLKKVHVEEMLKSHTKKDLWERIQQHIQAIDQLKQQLEEKDKELLEFKKNKLYFELLITRLQWLHKRADEYKEEKERFGIDEEISLSSVWDVLELQKNDLCEYEEMCALQEGIECIANSKLLADIEHDLEIKVTRNENEIFKDIDQINNQIKDLKVDK